MPAKSRLDFRCRRAWMADSEWWLCFSGGTVPHTTNTTLQLPLSSNYMTLRSSDNSPCRRDIEAEFEYRPRDYVHQTLDIVSYCSQLTEEPSKQSVRHCRVLHCIIGSLDCAAMRVIFPAALQQHPLTDAQPGFHYSNSKLSSAR